MNKMCAVILGSVLVAFAAQAVPTVTVEQVRGRAATVSFANLDAATTNSLVFAWGGADAAGATPDAWPNRMFAGLVRPGDATRTVTLPESVTGKLRAFLVEGVFDVPADYVRDGLIHEWDGIDNAGTGVHDSTAMVWKDKAGTLDLFLTPKGAWNAAGNALAVDDLSATGAVATVAYKTIEILFMRGHGASGNYIFSSGCCAQVNDLATRLVVNMGSTVQYTGCEHSPVSPVISDTVFAGAATYAGDSIEAIYQDGQRPRRPVIFYENWSSVAKAVMIGGRKDGRYGWSKGQVYAIRLHNRVLTDAEIAANHRLDAVRFLGVAPGTAVLAASDVTDCAASVFVVSTGTDLAGHPTTATLAFRGVTSPCDLVMAWGASDAGADPAAWPNRLDLGVVEPEDETRVVALPAGWGGASAAHARFFLKTGVDAPANYVGDGRMTWLDGIDNAGTGTHDSAATVWKDKAGALDFTLTNNATWNAAGNALVVAGISAVAEQSTIGYRTIEAVYRSTRANGRVVFMPNYHQKGPNTWDSSRILVDGGASEITYFSGYMNVPLKPVSFPYDSRRIRCVAAVYDGSDQNTGVYFGGRAVSSVAYYNDWGMGDAGATIGGRGRPQASAIYPWYGELHAIRLYSTVLSEAELLANHRLDLVRFCGAVRGTAVAAASADLTCVEGTAGGYGEETSETVATRDGLRVDLRDGVRVVEWRKQLLPFTCLPATVTDFTSGYARAGLINWWDGLDNTGIGAFDTTTRVWKDKAGNLDLLLTGNGSWNGTNALVVNGLSATGRVATAAYRTIELAFRMTKSGRVLFASGSLEGAAGASGDLRRRLVVFDHINNSTQAYFDGCIDTLYLPWILNAQKLRTMTGIYNDSHVVTRVYGDGVQDTSGKTWKNTWGNGGKDGVATVGNRWNANANYNWYGDLYAIRLYNRELTSAEIANNHALDLYRFSGEGGAPAGQFSARITVVQVTGEGDDVSTWTEEVPGTAKTLMQRADEGEVAWYAQRGVWRVTFELLFGTEKYLFHTETQVFDLRQLGVDGTKFFFR